MIRVNLLKNRIQTTPDATAIDDADFSQGFEIREGQGSPAVNFLLMVLFVVLMVVYESFFVSALKEETSRLQQQAATMETQVQQRQQESQEALKVQGEIRELETKIEILKSLSKNRLIELKALDQLQTLIPDKVWLERIEYDDQKFDLRGFAMSDEDLTDFLKLLEERTFFVNVILLQARETDSPQGTVKEFQITANLKEG